MNDSNQDGYREEHSLNPRHEDLVVRMLNLLIRLAVRVLAVLMAVLILLGVGDVVWVLYQKLLEPPLYLLSINDILATFGAFLAVLIAIEIFTNITMYLSDRVIHVKIVIATALMAVARKVIVFDFDNLGWEYVAATGLVVLGLGVTYWLVARHEDRVSRPSLIERLTARGSKVNEDEGAPAPVRASVVKETA